MVCEMLHTHICIHTWTIVATEIVTCTLWESHRVIDIYAYVYIYIYIEVCYMYTHICIHGHIESLLNP